MTNHTPSHATALETFLDGAAGEFTADDFMNYLGVIFEEGVRAGKNRVHHTNMTDEQAALIFPNPYTRDVR